MADVPTPNADEVAVLKNQEEIKALLQNLLYQVEILLKKIG